MIVVLAAAGLLTFLTGIFAGLLSGDSILEVVGWLAPIWLAITFLGAAVASIVSYLLVPLIIAIEWLLGLIPFDFTPAELEPVELDLGSQFATAQPEEVVEQLPQLFETSQRLLPVLIMVLVVLVVALALGRLFRMARRPAQSDRMTLSPLEGIGGLDSAGAARRILDRLGFIKRWRTATSIRRIYEAMSDMARQHGYPRLDYETPYEYLDALSRAWPEFTGQTHLITEAYIRVRYGEIPESKPEIENIKIAWEELRENEPSPIDAEESSIDLRRKL
jgi:hypothetical protein